MLTGSVAFRVAACGYLRHVDDHFDPGLLGGLSELSGRLHDPWTDRIAKVGSLHSAERSMHGVEIEEVAKHHLRAGLPQPLRSLVGPMRDHAYSMILFE